MVNYADASTHQWISCRDLHGRSCADARSRHKRGGEAVIKIGRKARLIRAGGMKDKAIQEALVIVQDHAEMLAEAWETIHGE